MSERSARGSAQSAAPASFPYQLAVLLRPGAIIFLVVKKEGEQCPMHLQAAVVVDEAHFTESVHEITPLDLVVPTISASVSWLTFKLAGSGLDCSPKFASTNRIRANRFSLELKIWPTKSCSIRSIRDSK
jgi:hypothetical protein